MPGFPRHTQSLGASRRKAGTLPAVDPDIIVAEIDSLLPNRSPFGLAVYVKICQSVPSSSGDYALGTTLERA